MKYNNEAENPVNPNEDNIYNVAYWRKEYTNLRPDLHKNWHTELAEFEPSLNTVKGANDMRAVSSGKASIVVTQHIVSRLKKMVTKQLLAKERWERQMERARERLRRIQGG